MDARSCVNYCQEMSFVSSACRFFCLLGVVLALWLLVEFIFQDMAKDESQKLKEKNAFLEEELKDLLAKEQN